MFSNGADVNLNKVYRSSSAASTDFKIGEIYRQAGSNAVFKFVEIGTATPSVVEGVPLVSGMIEAESLNAAAGVWAGASSTLGIFQGIAQNTSAVVPGDLSSSVTVCVWAQIAGNSLSYVSTDRVGEAGFDPANAATHARLTVTNSGASVAVTGTEVATVSDLSNKNVLYLYDGTVDTSGVAFTSLSANGAFTPYNGTTPAGGTGTAVAGVVSSVYKDSAGLVRGFRFTSGEAAFDVADNLIASGGQAVSQILPLAAPGFVSLRGTY